MNFSHDNRFFAAGANMDVNTLLPSSVNLSELIKDFNLVESAIKSTMSFSTRACGNGRNPVSNCTKITPADQTSTNGVYGCAFNTSGAIYNGEPTFVIIKSMLGL